MVAKHFEEVGYSNMGIITGPGNVMDSSFRKNGFVDHINEKSNLNELQSLLSENGETKIQIKMTKRLL